MTDARVADPEAARSGTRSGGIRSAEGLARTRPKVDPRTWSLKRRLAYAFVVAGTLFVLCGAAFGMGLANLVGAVNLQVDRLDPAVKYSSFLYNAMLNEETGVRGYALTNDKSFLEPYNLGVSEATGDAATLHRLVGPYPRLRARLGSALDQAARWRSDYALPAITALDSGKPVPKGSELAGKRDFDALRLAINAFDAEATKERSGALHRLHAATTQTVIEAVALGVLLVLAAIASWIGLGSWVRKPLESIRKETQTVTSGDLNHQVAITGPLEIMEVAAEAEAMRRQLILSLDDLSFKASELQRSNRELEQFAYVASHDLQEPLRKVASFCQMLESRYADQLDERARQYISFAVDGAKRMQVLINDLLAFSRVGQPGADFKPVDLNEVTGQAVSELEAAIEDSDATITVDPLPTVTGDRTLLIQLFANLLSNAIKFRRVDTPPAIRITSENINGMWEFACQDNGIGIEPAYRERVFAIFQRLHPRDAYPGTGIGLALCRKIVDFHGGKIWIEDMQPGILGTTIKWTLPTATTRQGASDGV